MVVVALSLFIAAATSTPRSGLMQVPEAQYPSEEALRRYAQGRLLEERNVPGEAQGEYLRVLLLDSRSGSSARRLSELSARLGDAAQSLEFADRALALEPSDARALWLKGAAQFNLGRAPEALQSLEAAVAADSDQVEYLRTLGRVGEELNRYDVVARAYRRAVAVDGEDSESWFQLAAAEARMGHFESARRALAETMANNPMRPGIFFLQGWIEEGLGEPDKAIDLYREHLKVHANDDVARRRLANLLVGARRYPEAYREAQTLGRSHPDDSDVSELEADLAFKLGRGSEGEQALTRLGSLAPDDPENLGLRIEVLARNKRGAQAVGLARAWSERHDRDFRGPMLSARAHQIAGEKEAALADARRAAEMAPDSLAPHLLLGRLEQLDKQWAEAAAVWAEVRRAHPSRLDVGLDLAYCREQMGNIEGAEQAARDVLAAAPADANALNFLGYLLADHDLKLEEAEGLIQKAMVQEPDNGAYLDSMGWVHYRLGRLEEARHELERAVRLSGGDPVVREHLGDVYKDLRLIELAREQYRMSLASDRSNTRVRTKLDGLR